MNDSLKDFIMESIARSTENSTNYRYEINVFNSERLGVPQYIKDKFSENMMLVIRSDQMPNVMYDINTKILSWNSIFNMNPWLIQVHVDDIFAVSDPWNNQIINFSYLPTDDELKVIQDMFLNPIAGQQHKVNVEPQENVKSVKEQIVFKKRHLGLILGGKLNA